MTSMIEQHRIGLDDTTFSDECYFRLNGYTNIQKYLTGQQIDISISI